MFYEDDLEIDKLCAEFGIEETKSISKDDDTPTITVETVTMDDVANMTDLSTMPSSEWIA